MFISFLYQTLIQAGEYALEKQNCINGFEKEDSSVLTEADLYVSALIKNKIDQFAGSLGLNYCIVDEELEKSFTDYLAAEYAFIIDPIDGTMNYANGHVLWGVSIGIFKDKKPFAGGVFLPAINKMLFTDGANLYKNGPTGFAPVTINEKSYSGKNKTIAITNAAMVTHKFSAPFIASENSTVSHMFFVNQQSHIGSIQKVNLWDTAASLAIGQVIGNFGWDIDGNKMEVFDEALINEDFSHKDVFVFSLEKYKNEIISILEKK